LPVAFDEQLVLGIASVTCVEKFVQPLSCRWEGLAGVISAAYRFTEFTTIVCGLLDGQLWCWAASSAAEAMTATP
jgi:hypothetical protein